MTGHYTFSNYHHLQTAKDKILKGLQLHDSTHEVKSRKPLTLSGSLNCNRLCKQQCLI